MSITLIIMDKIVPIYIVFENSIIKKQSVRDFTKNNRTFLNRSVCSIKFLDRDYFL